LPLELFTKRLIECQNGKIEKLLEAKTMADCLLKKHKNRCQGRCAQGKNFLQLGGLAFAVYSIRNNILN
jgi:hypothetical protein